jgi:hypothetical protein
MSISSEASMAQSTNKDNTTDSSWQHPNIQTPNTSEQAKKHASGSDGVDVESDASEKEREKSNMINGAVAEHNKRVDLTNEKAKGPGFSIRVSTDCSACCSIGLT